MLTQSMSNVCKAFTVGQSVCVSIVRERQIRVHFVVILYPTFASKLLFYCCNLSSL
jgi:hypothetical protein